MREEKKVLWMLVDGNIIGGAESRMVKIAAQLAKEKDIGLINLLVADKLYQSYKKHESLNPILDHPKIFIKTVKNKYALLYSYLRALFRKLSISNNAFEKWILKKKSWYYILRKNVNDNDIVHCYMGDNARNGALILSTYNNKIKTIIEITSNRLVERVAQHFQYFMFESDELNNLFVRSVSENVFKNWCNQFEDNWFKVRNIDNRYYNGPFIELEKETKSIGKENLIIFPHRFKKSKNGVLFSEVISELLSDGKLKNWRVLFRGAGSEQNIIERNLKKWIDQGIVEVGFSENLFSELKKSKIAVSLIKTGSYPSQSVFEAMQAGCTLLLADSGNTKHEFQNTSIFFTKINKSNIKNELIKLVEMDDQKFKQIETEMNIYFQWFKNNRNQINEVKELYEIR